MIKRWILGRLLLSWMRRWHIWGLAICASIRGLLSGKKRFTKRCLLMSGEEFLTSWWHLSVRLTFATNVFILRRSTVRMLSMRRGALQNKFLYSFAIIMKSSALLSCENLLRQWSGGSEQDAVVCLPRAACGSCVSQGDACGLQAVSGGRSDLLVGAGAAQAGQWLVLSVGKDFLWERARHEEKL